jgi:hypothetical protein
MSSNLLNVIRALLIVVALGLLTIQFVPVLVDRGDVGKAVIEWHRNPTPQTEVAMREELRRNSRVVVETRIEGFILLALDVVAIAMLSRCITKNT